MYRTYSEINNYKKNPPSLEIDKNAKTTLYKPLDLKTTKIRTYPHKQSIIYQLYSKMMFYGSFVVYMFCEFFLVKVKAVYQLLINRIKRIDSREIELNQMTCKQQWFAHGSQITSFISYQLSVIFILQNK